MHRRVPPWKFFLSGWAASLLAIAPNTPRHSKAPVLSPARPPLNTNGQGRSEVPGSKRCLHNSTTFPFAKVVQLPPALAQKTKVFCKYSGGPHRLYNGGLSATVGGPALMKLAV